MNKRVLFVYGTRPEAIKLRPVVKAMQEMGDFDPVFWFTHQTEAIYLDQDMLGPREDGYHWLFRARNVRPRYPEILQDLYSFVDRQSNDLDYIVVQGDTFSALAGTQVGYFNQIPVVHVEAGLRTMRENPWPEERIRLIVDQLSAIRFAPTPDSYKNLVHERMYPDMQTFMVGNTIVDRVMSLKSHKPFNKENLPSTLREEPYFVCSLHRRESWDQFDEMLTSLGNTFAAFPEHIFAFLRHPNQKANGAIEQASKTYKNVRRFCSFTHWECLNMMHYSVGVITDSGGMIEEAATLNRPCNILRDETERMEAVANSKAYLIGRTGGRYLAELISRAEEWFDSSSPNPFGDGKASMRIANILAGNAISAEIS
jgi:UDP-N-acetylglucosamine 2-epimerase (non-hydrolysing)